MKDYKTYMNRIEVSETLHARLLELGEAAAPRKRPVWKKYGALAAALALMVGAGAYAAATMNGMGNNPEGERAVESFEPAVSSSAPEPVPDGGGSSMKTIGGFEAERIVNGREVVIYYLLPWVGYGEEAASAAADIGIPEGCVNRALTREDVLSLLGGEEVLDVMLDWGGFELEGRVYHLPDGSVWQLELYGGNEETHITLELAPDVVPPTCVVSPTDYVTEIWGVEVSGSKAGMYGEGADREVWLPESREVTFVANGVGYRFSLYGLEGEAETVELMVSRFVRQAILEGLNLSAIGPEGVIAPEEDTFVSVGEPNWDDSGSEGASTPSYDPGAQASPTPTYEASPSRGPES